MIRIGLIGCGGMGDVHRQAMQQLAGRAQFTAAVDLDLARAQETAAALGCSLAVTDYHEVLPAIDAAIVAVPHHLHHPVGMDLLAAGKHLLMEKPLANSEAWLVVRCWLSVSINPSVSVNVRAMPFTFPKKRRVILPRSLRRVTQF